MLPSALAGLLPARPQSGNAHAAPPSFRSTPVDPVSLSLAGLNLAKQQDILADRVNELESDAADSAKNFLTNFARQILGDAADGMQVSFDFASVSASSVWSGMALHAENAYGTSDLAAMSLKDAADFVGRGKITTADGHVYSFEVEVHYEASFEAAASSRSMAVPQDARHLALNEPSHGKPAANEFDLHFPGKLKDLFGLLDHGSLKLPLLLPPTDAGNPGNRAGMLSLRLLDKLEHSNPLLQQLAQAYDNIPASRDIGTHA